MFTVYTNDNGAQEPHYYQAAAAGTYQVGQLLALNANGLAEAVSQASLTTPPMLCLFSGTVQAGENIPVQYVTGDVEFETELTAEAAAAKVGSLMEVSAGGIGVDAPASGTGSFRLTYLEGTAKDSVVRGRFI